MSMEKALLAQGMPRMLAAKAREIIREEIIKGCRPEISLHPVALEPPFRPVQGFEKSVESTSTLWTLEPPPSPGNLIRARVWISPEQKCDWNRSELFLKQLSWIHHRIALEILGNRKEIAFQLLCHEHDMPVLLAAFSGQFEKCEITPASQNLLEQLPPEAWKDAAFRDFYPPPPYSHLLTRPDELKRSPFTTLITALSILPPTALGVFQVVFAPVSPEHDWHRNVEALQDLEFKIKLLGGPSQVFRYAQQSPSGDLRQMAREVEFKSHNDKPFFAAAVRVGVIQGQELASSFLQSLALIASLIQHGGRPLEYLTNQDYPRDLSPAAIKRMFTEGLTYRSGFLVNSQELVSLVHIPPPRILEHLRESVTTLESLPPIGDLSTGTPVGVCEYAGRNLPVCIPDYLRTSHAHVIGGTGMGKSTVMEPLILHDVQQKQGVAVIDPHGRLVQRLLGLIPEEHADRVIYFNPGDPDWIPIWNPLRCRSTQGLGRLADDLVRAFKSFVTGWGDRLEHLLRHAILAVLHLPRGSLLDVSNLLRQKSEDSRRLRARILKIIDNELSRNFWKHDFDRYSSADLHPPQHKLSKLLTSGPVAQMLSQADSAFDFPTLMNSEKILLVDLSNIGPEVREILGCLILSLMHLTALGRGSGPGIQNRPFHIFCDEAHRFMTEAMEDMIEETRKFGVSLTLAHQQLSQFNIRKIDSFSNVGSTIIFKVGTKDAQFLRRDLQDKVEQKDLITLDRGQAITRIGNEVVRIRTNKPLKIPEVNCRDRIIEQSHARYYRPANEVKRAIRNREELEAGPLAPYRPEDIDKKSTDSPSGRSDGPGQDPDWDTFLDEAENYDRF